MKTSGYIIIIGLLVIACYLIFYREKKDELLEPGWYLLLYDGNLQKLDFNGGLSSYNDPDLIDTPWPNIEDAYAFEFVGDFGGIIKIIPIEN